MEVSLRSESVCVCEGQRGGWHASLSRRNDRVTMTGPTIHNSVSKQHPPLKQLKVLRGNTDSSVESENIANEPEKSCYFRKQDSSQIIM